MNDERARPELRSQRRGKPISEHQMKRGVRDHENLTTRERIIVECLAKGLTVRKTAIEVGLSEKTIWLARQRQHVIDAIFRRQTELFETSGGHGLNLMPNAIKVLDRIVNDPEARDSDKIAAAKTLMHSSSAYSERLSVERQLRDLEERLYSTIREEVADEPAPIAILEDDSYLDDDLASADPSHPALRGGNE